MVIRHILRYLIEHPDAKDTLQGLHRWWLPGGVIEWEEGVVQDALDMLVARGWLTQRQITSSRNVYCMNQDKLEEIQEFLREPESESEGERK
jgi:DNA-binding PadR family transcriptional regulator